MRISLQIDYSYVELPTLGFSARLQCRSKYPRLEAYLTRTAFTAKTMERQTPNSRPLAVFMGGTLSAPAEIEFANRLGAAIISQTNLAISVSGYRGIATEGNTPEDSPSFGFCVARGAQTKIDPTDSDLRIFTQIGPSQKPAGQYFAIGQVMHPCGQNRQAQQLSIVLSSAALCLGAGGTGTRVLYDYALGLDRPVLPLPFLGGMARTIWRKNKQEITAKADIPKDSANRWSKLDLAKLSRDEISDLAKEVATHLALAVRKRCLVFMSFAEHFTWVLSDLIEPAAEKASVDLVRIDFQDHVGDIVGMFESVLSLSDLTIAVVTGDSPNVFYEIGYAHALNKPVLILCQEGASTMRSRETPFYVRNHRTFWYPSRYDEQGLRQSIDDLAVAFRNLRPSLES